MKDKKMFLILGVVAIFILTGGYLVFKNKPSMTPTEKESQEIMEEVEKANVKLEKKVPDNLTQCTPEILVNAGNCSATDQEGVCGYDHTVYGDGKEKDHGIPYTSACHYCQLFGEEGVMELIDTKVTALGYEPGDCR